MQQQIELKSLIPKHGQKYMVLQITDIMLHVALKRATTSVGQKVKESFETGNAGRVYSPIANQVKNDKRTAVMSLLQNDPVFIKTVQEYENKGYKVAIALPKDGIPIVAGDDTKRFINSVKGKRILRRLEKGKALGKL
ncbi:MAG: hypothetical protein RLZZ308_591 [Candidatus Parcubacteria bacterium]|jgi:hypothetical protein